MITFTDREADLLVSGYMGGATALPDALKQIVAGREVDILRAIQVSLRAEGADKYARQTMERIAELTNDALEQFGASR